MPTRIKGKEKDTYIQHISNSENNLDDITITTRDELLVFMESIHIYFEVRVELLFLENSKPNLHVVDLIKTTGIFKMSIRKSITGVEIFEPWVGNGLETIVDQVSLHNSMAQIPLALLLAALAIALVSLADYVIAGDFVSAAGNKIKIANDKYFIAGAQIML